MADVQFWHGAAGVVQLRTWLRLLCLPRELPRVLFMLKRLELIGFKSFADKTRFDFAPGITCIVGPNGSGKSNIVDAVKWVLGEQSAKSLRGGEMADVIFNGSSTRKSLGLAEVSMTFDNARRDLNLDADEIQITRRVYRDGQGEYLINGQISRLKDIKELFLGSGAGHGAYSVIEQGRVDAVLMASTKDRRQIFEEAAGISRFRARKTETLRKLERVEADLQRVRDILQELEKQLRSLRLQAAKAQRYLDYSQQLRELRVAWSLRDYREIQSTLLHEEQKLAGLRAEAARADGQARTLEAEAEELAREIQRFETEWRASEAEAAAARQRIATQEATARFERGQSETLQAELLQLGRQKLELARRCRTLQAELANAAHERDRAQAAAQAEEAQAQAAETALRAAMAGLTEWVQRVQQYREWQFELVGRVARLQGDTETARQETERLRRELVRKRSETERTKQQHEALGDVLQDLTRTDADLQEKLSGARQNLLEHLRYQDELRRNVEELQHELETHRERRSDLRGRVEVLEDLEKRHDGIGTGVRYVLDVLAAGLPMLSDTVPGLVADLLTAPRDIAPWVDLALGEAAQRFVLREPARLDEVIAALGELPGRVGFVPLIGQEESLPRLDPAWPVQPLDRLVRVERADLADLPRRVLGRVLLVDDLATACTLQTRAGGYRWLTRQGEILEPDGTLTIGPAQSGAGILSRKSELRELHKSIATLEERILSLEARQTTARKQAETLDVPIQALQTEIAALGGEAGHLRDQIREQRQVQQQLGGLLDLLGQETSWLEVEVQRSETAWETWRQQAEEAELQAAQLKVDLARGESEIADRSHARDQRQTEHLAAQVALGRVQEQLASLTQRHDDLAREWSRRQHDSDQLAAVERSARQRLQQSQLATLRATAQSAEARMRQQQCEAAIRQLTAVQELARQRQLALQETLRAIRDGAAQHKDRAHAHELLVRDLVNRRDGLTARLREDYGLDLTALAAEANSPPAAEFSMAGSAGSADSAESDFEDVQAEIDELRRKIQRLGSVNLEALDELAEIERRETELRSQHDDLAQSQAKLLEIIAQINEDSRRLFTELMTTVRGHFLELFRKLFGGGTADIILEDQVNPLESGIEVTARPPGKELRSISLLSGGERTLTAIALLLAIFRSRPSPFCLLDEVDASLDEANTARLAAAIHEFLDRSQFIVVTHKKRTMAAAAVLYGITMQESGVSKQVAVRFEDWPDDPPEPAAVDNSEVADAGTGTAAA